MFHFFFDFFFDLEKKECVGTKIQDLKDILKNQRNRHQMMCGYIILNKKDKYILAQSLINHLPWVV
jgi:hypothetical protein